MVSRLWVTTISWDLADKVLSIWPYLRAFASSSEASVSSSTRKGGGLTCDMANKSAIDVRALSPPESISRPLIFLRGRETLMSMPNSSSPSSPSSGSISTTSSPITTVLGCLSLTVRKEALPPPKSTVKNCSNSLLTCTKPLLNLVSNVSLKLLRSSRKDFLLASKSASSRAKYSSRLLVPSYSFITSIPTPPASSSLILRRSSFLRRSACPDLSTSILPPDITFVPTSAETSYDSRARVSYS